MGKDTRYAQMLLDEVGAICDENKIEYQVVWGPQEFGTGIVMTPQGASKFMDCIKESMAPNRAVECWDNSEIYPDDTIRYIGTDSTSYNVLDYTNYVNHGIFVEINVLRSSADSLGSKFNKAIEVGIRNKAYNFKQPSAGKKSDLANKIYSLACSLYGGDVAVRKRAFARMLKAQAPALTEETANNFKYKKYGDEYADFCVVEPTVDSAWFFSEHANKVGALSGEKLAGARKVKTELDNVRIRNKPNIEVARIAWEIIQATDDAIKARPKEGIEEENNEEAKAQANEGAK